MNSKQKRIAARKYKNVLTKQIASVLDRAADLIADGNAVRAESELREAAENIRKEFGK